MNRTRTQGHNQEATVTTDGARLAGFSFFLLQFPQRYYFNEMIFTRHNYKNCNIIERKNTLYSAAYYGMIKQLNDYYKPVSFQIGTHGVIITYMRVVLHNILPNKTS